MAKILHLVSSNERRGAEIFATELAEHLRGVGHDVRVLAIEPSSSPTPLDVEVAGRHRFDPVGVLRLLRSARASDVVVSFGSTSLISGAVAARLVRRPFVYRNIGDPRVWGSARLAGLRVGVPLRTTRGIVALYPDAAVALQQRYRIDPGTIRIIPRGVSAERYRPVPPEERSAAAGRIGLDPQRTWIAYIGALSPEKDPLFALDILRLLPPEIGLVVAGSGVLADDVAAAGADLGDRLRLLGSVDDVHDVLAAADVLVLTSRTEGIPGVVIEAALSGLPAVATDVGGVSLAVEDGVTGRVVERDRPEAFAAAVLDVIAAAEDMGAAAVRRARETYSMAVVGGAWEHVIAAVTARRGSPSVLHVTSSNSRRGAESFAVELDGALRRSGWESSTAAVWGEPSLESLPIRLLGPGRFRPATLWRLARAVRSQDVVVAHGSDSLIPVAICSALMRRPFVYRMIGDPSYWGRVRLAGPRIGRPLRRAAAVVSLTDEFGAVVARRYGLDPAIVVTSPNAVDIGSFGPATSEERAAARARISPPAADVELVIGYLGSLSTEKRPDWAVAAAGAIETAHLLVAGEGALRDELVVEAERVAPGRVTFLGTVTDRSNFFAAIDVLVLPSRTEGIPAVAIEAALSGVPVVATDVGGVAGLLEDLDGDSVVVDADDLAGFVRSTRAVGLAAAEVAERSPLGAGVAHRYSIDAVAETWSGLLERAVGGRGPGGDTARPRYRRTMAARTSRLLDLVVLAVAAVPASLLGLGCALAVRCTSKGPILFRQERIGRHGRPFEVLKFRTMVDGDNPIFPDASRITSAGRVLRRFSLDELPQLINVARGEMSVVGPRPTLAYQVERYDDRQRRRLDVRPGLTGLAQVSGRNALSWDERIELDIRYVERQSLRLDLDIIRRTASTLLRGEGVEGHPTDDALASEPPA